MLTHKETLLIYYGMHVHQVWRAMDDARFDGKVDSRRGPCASADDKAYRCARDLAHTARSLFADRLEVKHAA